MQAIAVSQPPPSANPLTAAITGLPRFSTRSRTACPNVLDFSRFDGADLRKLTDIGAGDECFVTGSSQDDAAHGVVVLCILEGGFKILPRSLVQSVEDFRSIEGDIGDWALLRVKDTVSDQFFVAVVLIIGSCLGLRLFVRHLVTERR